MNAMLTMLIGDQLRRARKSNTTMRQRFCGPVYRDCDRVDAELAAIAAHRR